MRQIACFLLHDLWLTLSVMLGFACAVSIALWPFITEPPLFQFVLSGLTLVTCFVAGIRCWRQYRSLRQLKERKEH